MRLARLMSSGQACAPTSSIDSSRKAKRHSRSALKRLVYQQCAALWVSWTTGCEKLAILAAVERHDNDQRDELAKEQKENLQKQAAALDREIAQVSTQIPATAAYADTLKQLADRLVPMAAKSNIAHMDFEVRRESYMASHFWRICAARPFNCRPDGKPEPPKMAEPQGCIDIGRSIDARLLRARGLVGL